MPALIPFLPWLAVGGVAWVVLDKSEGVLDASTRLTIALTVAGGGYVAAKALKVI